jgi:hypothetical protein
VDDLHDRLRAETTRRAQEFSPSADLGDRIGARVRQRRRQRRLLAGALSTAVIAVVAAGVILARPSDEDSLRVDDDRQAPTTASTSLGTTTSTEDTSTGTEATSTTTGPPANSATTSPPATSTTPPASPSGPAIGPDTALSRSGIGPIRAGMTLREAEAAAGISISPDTSLGPGSTCITAQIEGLDLWFVAALSGTPGEDPMDGVIGSVQGGRRTVEGVAIGDPITDLNGVYGSPTRTLAYPYLTNGQVFVYESGGFAYSVTTDGATVTELESGDPDWVANLEGCA